VSVLPHDLRASQFFPINIKQSIDLFKLGVNYKFELASLGASGVEK
jgi:hypothetical protein